MPRRRQDRGREGRQGQGRVQVHHGHQPAGLHGAAPCAWASARWTPLTMVDQEQEAAQQEVFNYCVSQVSEKKDMQDNTVKAASSVSPCWSSPAPAPAAPRPAMPA